MASLKQHEPLVRALVWIGVQTGLARVRAGFHHDGSISRPGDGEAKRVALRAQAESVGQNHRLRKEPLRGRKAGEGVTPSGSAGQIMHRRVVITNVPQSNEHSRIGAGSVALEIDAGQAPAPCERILPDAGDTARNRDAGQAGQPMNALCPMLVTPLAIVALVRLVQL